MNRLEFNAACCSRLIDPSIALENESVCAAIANNDMQALITALESEF